MTALGWAIVGIVPVVLLAAAACSRGEVPGPRAAAAAVEAATPVVAEAVTTRTIRQTIEPVGTVRSRAQTVVSSKIVASVVAVHAREGQRVRAGEVLVVLDDRDLAAQRARAQAALTEARASLEEVDRTLRASDRGLDAARARHELATSTLGRYRTLFERELVARQEYDEVRARARTAAADVARLEESHAALGARRRQAGARIEQADADLAGSAVTSGYARLLAPLDGVVVSRTVEVGTLAAPGVPLLVVESETYRLEATVEESEIRHVRLGQSATVAIDALGRERAGVVTEIVPAADPASRTFLVKIDLGGAAGLRSGLYGRARFVVGERRGLLVPPRAVVERGQLQTVFVVDATSTARLRLVRTGRTRDGELEVLSGLAAGERVVTDGGDGLTDGTRVRVRA